MEPELLARLTEQERGDLEVCTHLHALAEARREAEQRLTIIEQRAEEVGELRHKLHEVEAERDTVIADLRWLLKSAEAITVIPYGGCDIVGHNSPDVCWWFRLIRDLRQRHPQEEHDA